MQPGAGLPRPLPQARGRASRPKPKLLASASAASSAKGAKGEAIGFLCTTTTLPTSDAPHPEWANLACAHLARSALQSTWEGHNEGGQDDVGAGGGSQWQGDHQGWSGSLGRGHSLPLSPHHLHPIIFLPRFRVSSPPIPSSLPNHSYYPKPLV